MCPKTIHRVLSGFGLSLSIVFVISNASYCIVIDCGIWECELGVDCSV